MLAPKNYIFPAWFVYALYSYNYNKVDTQFSNHYANYLSYWFSRHNFIQFDSAGLRINLYNALIIGKKALLGRDVKSLLLWV